MHFFCFCFRYSKKYKISILFIRLLYKYFSHITQHSHVELIYSYKKTAQSRIVLFFLITIKNCCFLIIRDDINIKDQNIKDNFILRLLDFDYYDFNFVCIFFCLWFHTTVQYRL